MLNYFKIIRFQNLFFLAFIQFVIREIVLLPILQMFGFDTVGNSGVIGFLILASVLIAAGGYVLNDYFDIKIDAINKPDKQIVGKIISRKNAMLFYQVLTGLGIVLGLSLSFFLHSFTLGFIFIIVPGLLWFYSASYKRQFMLGNLVVSFISGLSILMVAMAEVSLLQKTYGSLLSETPISAQFYAWTSGFAVFAFLCTWIREIIKDMEDVKGDMELEARTMPIKWGIKKTKFFVYGLIVFVILALLRAAKFIPFEGSLTIRYVIFGLILPLIVLAYLVYSAKTPSDYHQASTLSKVIMLIGVLYCFIFNFLQAKTYGLSLFNLFLIQ